MGQVRYASSRPACGKMFLRAAHLLFGVLHQNGAGTPRIVTASLRANVPQSSAPAFWGAASEWGRHAALRHGQPTGKCSSEQRTCLLGCCIRMGQARCASSRPACGKMFLRAAHLPFGALHKNGAGTLRFVTASLRKNVPQSSAPAFWGAASEWGRHAAHRHGWPSAKCSSEQRTCPFGNTDFYRKMGGNSSWHWMPPLFRWQRQSLSKR